MAAWLSKHFNKTIAAIFLLSLIDALATIFFVTSGMAVEANPVMEMVLNIGPYTFLTVKTTMVSLSLFILYKVREYSFTLYASAFLCAIYFLIFLWHLYHMVLYNVYV